MVDGSASGAETPPFQHAIRARCVHPAGAFVRFEEDALEQSIATRFEQQAARYGDRMAVQTAQHGWTYEDLNRAANRMARAILARQGDAAEPVALLFSNAVHAIIAILGVLKAGKFYVPLDASFPQARVAEILKDAGANLLVTDTLHQDRANSLAAEKVGLLVIDAPDAQESEANPTAAASPADLACLLYTSGSTGRPKG
jgi:non-ribosomal peptide synthetase component F